MFSALAAAPDKPKLAWEHFSVTLTVLKQTNKKKTTSYFSSWKHQPIFFIYSFWRGKKKKKRKLSFEPEKLSHCIWDPLWSFTFFPLSKPRVSIWRMGVPSSPFLPLTLSKAQGFPSHTFSFFFCHFHFTRLREGFGLSKERKQNKNRTISRNDKMESQTQWSCFLKWETVSFRAQPNFHFFLPS